MSLSVISLQDHAVRVSQPEAVLLESPGYADIAGKQPVFGSEARRLSRLHPRQNHNQFWSQLSLDPLVDASGRFRHHADLAYGHLLHLVEEAGIEGEVLFAVPGSYSRQQLAILLGLVKQSPVTARGLVDLAVAACAAHARRESSLFIDLQLHQCVLSRLLLRDGRLQRDKVVQIPGAGLLALEEAWAAMIRDAFIKQSRFDPLHRAETEQFIHNRLPDWLAELAARDETLLEIEHKGHLYQAKVSRGFFEQRARPVFTRIRREVENVGGDADLFLPASQLSLPGLSLYLPEPTALDEGMIAANCFAHIEHIQGGDPEALSFVTALPAAGDPGGPGTPAPARQRVPPAREAPLPSHVLVNHTAYPLPASQLYLGPLNGESPGGEGVRVIAVDDPALRGNPLRILRDDRGLLLESDNARLRVNGSTPGEQYPLRLGDRIHFEDSGLQVQLIQVE